MAGFVRSLRATWRTFLTRFVLAFVVLGFAWSVLAPAYAHLLVILGRPLVPMLEAAPGTTYQVRHASIWTRRSVRDPGTGQMLTFEFELWRGYANYDLILLVALVFATPGWSLRQKGRLAGLGLVLLTVAEFAFFLVTIESSQLQPLPTSAGSVFLQGSGFSRPRQILFNWLRYFFDTMGRGLFPLLVYWAMLGATWRPADRRAPAGAPRRNDPCPCGSGKRYKRCCGK